MVVRLALILVLLAPPVAALGSAGPLPSFLQALKTRPVTKVVNLLKDMQKQLEKEVEEDEEIYEKLACWCETNDK
jgi:hypothetical protein